MDKLNRSALLEALDVLLPETKQEEKTCFNCVHRDDWCEGCKNYSEWHYFEWIILGNQL